MGLPLNSGQQVQLAQMAQAVMSLNRENEAAYQTIDQLMKFLHVNVILNKELMQQDALIQRLSPWVDIAQIWCNEALASEQVLQFLCNLLMNPEFLMYWSFEVWSQNNITPLGVELLSEGFIKLTDPYYKSGQAPPALPNSNGVPRFAQPVYGMNWNAQPMVNNVMPQMQGVPIPPIVGNQQPAMNPQAVQDNAISGLRNAMGNGGGYRALAQMRRGA